MKKRLLAGFLTLAILVSLFPIPALAAEDVTISTLGELEAFRDAVNNGDTYAGKTVILVNDIDMSEKYGEGEGKESWTPIGTSSKKFSGTFDGSGHEITGLYINAPNDREQGLFGCIEYAEVKNLGVSGTVIGEWDVGGVAGYSGYSSITNCYNTGTITGKEGKDYLELAEKIGAFDFAAWKKPREKSVISVSPSTIQRTCWTKS